MHRATDGRSGLPLLHDADDVERSRPSYDAPVSPHTNDNEWRSAALRRTQLRSRSPGTAAKMATRKKYTYAAGFLLLSLISFTIQTETAVYIQHNLGWKKAYCML